MLDPEGRASAYRMRTPAHSDAQRFAEQSQVLGILTTPPSRRAEPTIHYCRHEIRMIGAAADKTGRVPGLLAERTLLWWRTSEWEAVGVWVTGLLTVGLLVYAARQLHESRELRDEQSRPYVIVDFHFKSIMISLSVKNIGQTPAKDLRVHLDDRLTSAVMPSVEWQDSGLFADGVSTFAPGREMRFALDTFPSRVEARLPMSLSGRLEYRRFDDDAQANPIVEWFRIDMSAYSEALLPPKTIAEVGDELETIRKILAKWPQIAAADLPDT